MYSVVLLKESTIVEHKSKDATKFFEESIILLNVEEVFFEKKSPETLLAYFNEKSPHSNMLMVIGRNFIIESYT